MSESGGRLPGQGFPSPAGAGRMGRRRNAMTKRRRLILVGATVISLAVCISIPALALMLRRHDAPPPAGMEDPADVVAREYITAKEGWPASAYTVENTHTWDGDGNLIVNVIHKDDLTGLTVGGGKSLVLHIDLEKRRVAEILHFQ
jgi:hypothetical protein